ncbi:MAG: arginase family protein [Sutterellaceae bacterium]|nr:arginase family protein [Sutterellaceae bacterium]MDD7441635.1 arginase family protein [Sutterellaceae bacterium]MDY2867981.1 arginase family protein [Mesosutterella sp.]
MKTIRLIYPQWQGGISPEDRLSVNVVPEDDMKAGYMVGARILDLVAPPTKNETWTVPVSTGLEDTGAVNGIRNRGIVLSQLRAALGLLDIAGPDRIATLGGECSVSLAPFSWLASRYSGDTAMIWLDRHADALLPLELFDVLHTMTLAHLVGRGDPEILSLLPQKIDPRKTLHIGLRPLEPEETREKLRGWGCSVLSRKEVLDDPARLTAWLEGCGASRALVHLDLGVLDPSEFFPELGRSTGGMRIPEVIDVIERISSTLDLVGISISDPVPHMAAQLRRLLRNLPLF